MIMKHESFLLGIIALLLQAVFLSCNKDDILRKEEPDFRKARITHYEIPSENYSMRFIYGEDGKLDSVIRAGDFFVVGPDDYSMKVIYEDNIVRFSERDIIYWQDAQLTLTGDKISSISYQIVPGPPFPVTYQYERNYLYKNDGKLNIADFRIVAAHSSIQDVFYSGSRLINFKIIGSPVSIPILFQSDSASHLEFDISYIENANIPADVRALLNMKNLKIMDMGGDWDFVDWKNLVYGFSGFKLPVHITDGVISSIRAYGYKAPDDLQLIYDQTTQFNYDVDTMQRSIRMGNEVIYYEFY